MTAVGKLIVEKRAELKMEQAQLAKLLEVSVSYLWRLETGKDVLPMKRVNDLAYALDMEREPIAEALKKDSLQKLRLKFKKDALKNRVILV